MTQPPLLPLHSLLHCKSSNFPSNTPDANHHTMLMQQVAALQTAAGDRRGSVKLSSRLAINWLLEDSRDLDTPVQEEIDTMRESFDGHQE